MRIKITAQKKSDLLQRHKKEKDGKVRDRIKAILLCDKGYLYTKIAEILLIDDETVRRHIKEYMESEKLAPRNGGSDSCLNISQTKGLIDHLTEKTYFHVKDIWAYVQNTYGVNYSVSGMRQWLHANGFRYKKPHGVPAKADQSKQQEFIKAYEELKNNLPEDEVIYFGDSVHPAHQTRLAYGWIKKGIRKSEKMTGRQKRINLIGAINVSTGHTVIDEVDWVNIDSLKVFANHLIEDNPQARVIHLILDNAGYHKSKAFTEWIKGTKIIIHFLPPYSPNLNPIERLWKIMHESVTYSIPEKYV